jgi:predicted nuclease of predicted toxin-antitoxin system
MKFLCDVHIPYKLRNFLRGQGYAATHVNELPGKSETTDQSICSYADNEGCILITKDLDFIDSYYLKVSPKKIVKINLGNIVTNERFKSFQSCCHF